jgi:hypothetical protein
MEAADIEYRGKKETDNLIKGKIKEIFGEDANIAKIENKSLNDGLGINIEVKYGGKTETAELNTGMIMSIYAWNRQRDGKIKLRQMGITQDVVDRLTEKIDEKYLELADWVTEELLPHTYEKYNATHLRMFGTELPQIEMYFPLVLNKKAIRKDVDISKEDTDTNNVSTITGSIMPRTRNRLALDIQQNFFDILRNHENRMENWNAYAELRQDINALLSDRTVMNKLNELGEDGFKRFKTAAKAALGFDGYSTKSEEIIQNVMSKFSASKIGYRYWTAAKQILALPVVLQYALEPGFTKSFMHNIANVKGSIKWSFANLPSFERRWKSRSMGDENLSNLKDSSIDKLMKGGMRANAAVDLMACALVARTVYDVSLNRYKGWGLSEESRLRHKPNLMQK